MAVFRVERNTGYTVMSNHHLRNKELSLKAKGLLSQMLSLPEDWDYTLAGLSYINREKIDAIREAVRELERAGYIQRSRERDEKGRLRGTDYIIYEQPPNLDLPTLENPTLENPTQEKPTLENPMQLNKDIQKTDLSKKEKSNTDLSSNHSIPILSPNRTHFMVELSPTFMQLASSKDTDRLFSMLPYKTLSFSKIEGRHGTYALIDKNENRGTDIRRVRPSIRAQLAADKRKAAPKKAAVKSKNHELEV